MSSKHVPQPLQASYKNHFNGTAYDQHYIMINQFVNEANYNGFWEGFFGQLSNHQGEDRLVKYPDK
ncbi:MAG: hypothetical protein CMH48_06785 [Muricauda sp.]|nr:hypothetical protein [Allomuricauda sp.]MAU26942.1 hypothetical protein [Allomuricauda sp.]MBC30536.1 hypothetical protein [Allomuricauda sp.]|tara:strand:+ start:2659 stop:2856 length:198 start_codon:yes stop_codon:yes gene_type:complete